jgi:hypothetical protein
MALISTSGSADANSYVESIEEAHDIAIVLATLQHFGLDITNWNAASELSRETALTYAASRIDQAAFIGVRSTDLQARAWPRQNTGRLQITDTIPEAVKHAQVAEACEMLRDRQESDDHAARGISSFSIGEQSVSYDRNAASNAAEGAYSSAAQQILRGAGLIMGRVGSVPIMRG